MVKFGHFPRAREKKIHTHAHLQWPNERMKAKKKIIEEYIESLAYMIQTNFGYCA